MAGCLTRDHAGHCHRPRDAEPDPNESRPGNPGTAGSGPGPPPGRGSGSTDPAPADPGADHRRVSTSLREATDQRVHRASRGRPFDNVRRAAPQAACTPGPANRPPGPGTPQALRAGVQGFSLAATVFTLLAICTASPSARLALDDTIRSLQPLPQFHRLAEVALDGHGL